LVSTPCDSPAAGLIALGAMRRRLESHDADDASRHLQRLRALASDREHPATLRHRSRRWQFRPELEPETGLLWACQIDGRGMGERLRILDYHATDWFVEGEPPLEVLMGDRLSHGGLLAAIADGAGAIVEATLAQSDAAISLAGRVRGESETRRFLSRFRFRAGSDSADLSQLLSVHEWHPGLVSRVTFFNPRTGRLDRSTDPPRVVIVDGGTSLLRVLEFELFRNGDVIAVIPRDADHDELEDVAQRISSLSQWYTDDGDLATALPACPVGVAVRILERR